MNRLHFNGMDYAPTADFGLLMNANNVAQNLNIRTHVGSVLSTDIFYKEDTNHWRLWADHGVLAIEMETSVLYTLAARHKVRALTLLSVSDSLVTHESSSALERETRFGNMVKVALQIAP
jgi:purine-nucleoside phosphorylase